MHSPDPAVRAVLGVGRVGGTKHTDGSRELDQRGAASGMTPVPGVRFCLGSLQLHRPEGEPTYLLSRKHNGGESQGPELYKTLSKHSDYWPPAFGGQVQSSCEHRQMWSLAPQPPSSDWILPLSVDHSPHLLIGPFPCQSASPSCPPDLPRPRAEPPGATGQ